MPLLLPGSSHHPPYTAVAVIIGGAAVSMGLYWYFKALNNKSDEEQRESGTTQDAGDGVSALLSPSHCTSEPAGSRPEDSAAIPSNMVTIGKAPAAYVDSPASPTRTGKKDGGDGLCVRSPNTVPHTPPGGGTAVLAPPAAASASGDHGGSTLGTHATARPGAPSEMVGGCFKWTTRRGTFAGRAAAVTEKGAKKGRELIFPGSCSLTDDGAVVACTWKQKKQQIGVEQLIILADEVAEAIKKLDEEADGQQRQENCAKAQLPEDFVQLEVHWLLQQWDALKQSPSNIQNCTAVAQQTCTHMEAAINRIVFNAEVDVGRSTGIGGYVDHLNRACSINKSTRDRVSAFAKRRNAIMHFGLLCDCAMAQTCLLDFAAVLKAYCCPALLSSMESVFQSIDLSSMQVQAPPPTWALPPEFMTSAYQRRRAERGAAARPIARPWLLRVLLEELRARDSVLLTAPAGFGKSTVMEELCWPQQALNGVWVVAQHFCRYNEDKAHDARVAVCSIAAGIAQSFLPLASHIQQRPELGQYFEPTELSRKGGCCAALEHGVLEPLADLDEAGQLGVAEGSLAIIVIDALDEATGPKAEHSVLELAQCLHDWLGQGRLPWLRLMCSSRRDKDVDFELETISKVVIDAENERYHGHIEDDFHAFLDSRLLGSAALQSRFSQALAESQLSEDVLKQGFLQRAVPSFRWLSFALSSIEEHEDANFHREESLPKGLGPLYKRRFQHEFPAEEFWQLKPIFEVILTSPEPLGTQQLFAAVRLAFADPLPWEMFEPRVEQLRGYASMIAGRWQLDHKSVADWLLSKHAGEEYRCSLGSGARLLVGRMACHVLDADRGALQGVLRKLRLPSTSAIGPQRGIQLSFEAMFIHLNLLSAEEVPEEEWVQLASELLTVMIGSRKLLHIEAADIGDLGALALAQAMTRHHTHESRSLASLAIIWSDIGDEGAKALAAALQPRQDTDGDWVPGATLQELNLRDNDIGDEGAKALAAALEPRQDADGNWVPGAALQELNLHGNDIGAEGATALAAALQPRQDTDGNWVPGAALQELRLAGNDIGDEGAKALAAALQPRQDADGNWVPGAGLRKMSIDKKDLGEESAQLLSDALDLNKRLASQVLDSYDLNDVGEEFFSLLKAMVMMGDTGEGLQSVTLESTEKGDDGSTRLSAIYAHGETLLHAVGAADTARRMDEASGTGTSVAGSS